MATKLTHRRKNTPNFSVSAKHRHVSKPSLIFSLTSIIMDSRCSRLDDCVKCGHRYASIYCAIATM